MNSSQVARFIEIKQQIADLERELEELKESVFSTVDGQGGEIDDDAWVIRSYKQPRYKFSDNYEKKNAELKELRKQEIENGKATVETWSEYVKLNFKKPSDQTTPDPT